MAKSLSSDNCTEMSSSIEVIQDKKDFFSEMYLNTVLKHFTVATFFMGTFLGLLSMSGIIWYERRGSRYRTVLNQLFSTLAWIVVWYIFLVYIPEGLRFLIGPLNETYCEVYIFLKNALFFGAFLTLDCISLLRYAFIFKLTNFAVVNDDMIARILNLSVAFVSVWLYMVKRMSFGTRLLHYCICAGKDPNERNEKSGRKSMPGKYNTTIILVCISVIVHIFVFTKIFLYQRKMEQDGENIELGHINTAEGHRQKPKEAWSDNRSKSQPSFLSKSIIDFTTQILSMMYLVIVSVLQGVMSSMEPSQLNHYSNRWYAYFLQIIGIAVAINVISWVYYARNMLVSRAIWRRIKEQWQD